MLCLLLMIIRQNVLVQPFDPLHPTQKTTISKNHSEKYHSIQEFFLIFVIFLNFFFLVTSEGSFINSHNRPGVATITDGNLFFGAKKIQILKNFNVVLL